MAQEPMAMHHLGSGIWSQSFLTRGAIFTVMVPATTITSACRGVARTMVPMRSRSTRLAAAARGHGEHPQGVGHPPGEQVVEHRGGHREAGHAEQRAVQRMLERSAVV